MKFFNCDYRLLFVLTVVALTFASQGRVLAKSETRTWTSKQGSKITASFVEVEGDKVALKMKNGKVINAPINSLSDADVAYINSKKPKQAAELKVVNHPNYMPNLMDGPGRGSHAYYKGDNFIAKVDHTGMMEVQYTDNGDDVKEKWHLRIIHMSAKLINGQVYAFKPEKITNFGEPKNQPDSVSFTIEREQGITVEVVYEFSNKGINTWFRVELSPSAPAELWHTMNHGFQDVREVSREKDFLQKMKVKQKVPNKGTETYNFYELKDLKGHADEYSVSGPLFGRGKIVVDKPSSDEVILSGYNYPGSPLGHGFTVFTKKDDIGSKNIDKEKAKITIK